MYPETIVTRVQEALRKRRLSCDAGGDGWSWLTLYVPTVSAPGTTAMSTGLGVSSGARTGAAVGASGAYCGTVPDLPSDAVGDSAGLAGWVGVNMGG